MSITISGTVNAVPSVADVVEQLNLNDISFRYEVDQYSPWPEQPLQVWRHGLSTRTTEVNREGRRVSVRIFSLASSEDHELALKLLRTFSIEGPVDAEELGQFDSVEDLAPALGEEAAGAKLESGYGILKSLVDRNDSPVDAPGPVRSTWFGPRVFEEIDNSDLPVAEAVVNFIRKVQWEIDPRFEQASIFLAGPPEKDVQNGADPDAKFSLAMWLSDRAIVLPRVEKVAVRSYDEDIVLIPHDAAHRLAGDRWTFIDEAQGCIEAISGADWMALYEEAKAIAES